MWFPTIRTRVGEPAFSGCLRMEEEVMETDKRPNILLITTDQQRFDTIRSLGNPLIRTPHIDHLVRNGIAFTSAYSDCPVCIPARWTLMNGLRAASYQHAYYQDRDPLAVDPVRSLPGLLSGAGYQTHAVGKMHFWPERARYGFDSIRQIGRASCRERV